MRNSNRFTTAAILWTALIAGTAAGSARAAAPAGENLRANVLAAYAGVRSYQVTVLGSVRSVGVWVAPGSYQMTTEFEGKTVKTVIVGRDLYEYDDGKWQKSGEAGDNLAIDIAGLVRTLKADPNGKLMKLPDQSQDGKRVGTFGYNFKNGTDETCNYDLATYRVTRCKADETTLLYSGYNAPTNRVAKVR